MGMQQEPREREDTVVVYDETGEIRHIHKILIIGEGTDERGAGEIETVAIEYARQFGHADADLKALTVKSADIDLSSLGRVDTAERRLVAGEAAA